MSKRTWGVAALIATLGVSGVGQVQAAVICLDGYYWFASYNNTTEEPLEGSVSFELKSPSFNPDLESPDDAWKTLHFNFSFLGQSWDRFDVHYGDVWAEVVDETSFEVRSLNFSFSDATDYWDVSFNFEDGNFGLSFNVGDVSGDGSSDEGTAEAYGEWDGFMLLPEPGSLTLFGLGLAGLGLSRRRKAA